MRLLFVTNICPHYRVRTYETLAERADVDFVFFSDGKESYWDRRHGVQHGNFRHEYLSGFYLTPRFRVTPGLVVRLWRTPADVIVKCINGRFALPTTYLLARLRRKPLVLWTGIWSHPQTFFHRATFRLTRFLYLHADAIVVYGPHVRDYLIGLGVKPERIFIAWHAVDNLAYASPVTPADIATMRAQLGIELQSVVLYVGRLDPAKGLGDLIQAVSRVPEQSPVLVLVGAGELKQALADEAASVGVIIRFADYVPTGQLYRWYALANVFVLPSITTRRHKEPWGLVVNEAMNQGVPVITTDAVGAAAGGLVRDGETGLVVPEQDPVALAGALRRILSDPDYGRRLGHAGKREIAHWTNERMVSGFVAAAEYAQQHQPRSPAFGGGHGRKPN